MAPRHGFEPRFTAPKAAVLPLDDRGLLQQRDTFSLSSPPRTRNAVLPPLWWCLKLALAHIFRVLGVFRRRDDPKNGDALLADFHPLYQGGLKGPPGRADKSPCSAGSHLFAAWYRNVLNVRFDLRHWRIVASEPLRAQTRVAPHRPATASDRLRTWIDRAKSLRNYGPTLYGVVSNGCGDLWRQW